MTKIKTSELTGASLDWAVAKCEGITDGKAFAWFYDRRDANKFSTDWSQGGPIIERESISITKHADQMHWWAGSWDARHTAKGPTPLISAMRCYVASKLGDTVEIPEELTK